MNRRVDELLDLLFGCTHRNLSRVFSVRRRTYKVCLDCGREFEYSLSRMCIVEASSHKSPTDRIAVSLTSTL